MKTILSVLCAALCLLTVTNSAHADGLVLFPGAELELFGNWQATVGRPNPGQPGGLIAGLRLGTMADATNWNVTAFGLEPSDCLCISFTTPFFSLLLDSSNDTLHGLAISFYLDNFF